MREGDWSIILVGLLIGFVVMLGPVIFRRVARLGSLSYDDYRGRWLVRREEGEVRIANLPGEQTVRRMLTVHEAPMGDYLKEYIQHLNRPRWRRRYDWSVVEEAMRANLNMQILHWRE